jgi:glutamate-1-semialdehyde 2,1-aminomutase
VNIRLIIGGTCRHQLKKRNCPIFFKEKTMASPKVEKIKEDILNRYMQRTKKSREHNEKAKQFMPGGDTRSIAYYPPYPFFAEKGAGCYLYDVDGNGYIDFVNNMTSLIHGHAHPHVMAAIRKTTEVGTTHGMPVESQYRLAELLCKRIPSLKSLRFGNTGSEATMFCLRAARAFTGKEGILKMDGGYHGGHDFVQVNTMPDLTTKDLPKPQATKGVPKCVEDNIFIAPFNDLTATEHILRSNQDKIAAVILEPMLGAGGGVAPRDGYLKGLRELTDRYGVLLIFDEVISFRLHEGGLQTMAGVTPDLTALGKIIGGGFPIGAFGGRKDIMSIFDPNNPDAVAHSGTFSGNAVTMAAGIANLEIYPQNEVDRINSLGERLAAGLKQAMVNVEVIGGTRGIGSLVGIHFTEKPLATSRDVVLTLFPSFELLHYLHLEMLNRGIYLMSRGMFVVSTPMMEKQIDACVANFEAALRMLKPLADEIKAG